MAGADPDLLAANDVGRAAIAPLLVRQGTFCNSPDGGEWGYGAINGRRVPLELLSICPVPDNVTDLVIASDGYPRIFPTLKASEHALAMLLAEDPLCIGPLRGTKGLTPGNHSYDDRAYLSLQL